MYMLGVLVVVIGVLFWLTKGEPIIITSFQECADAGFPIMESYPRRCSDGNQTFTEDIILNDKIRVELPRSGDKISNPVKVKGEARGNWYFEASFPIRLYDANGKELAIGIAQAQGEWMTTEFVPFELELSYPTPETLTGTLVFQKDNPSGLPEFDESVSIDVKF